MNTIRFLRQFANRSGFARFALLSGITALLAGCQGGPAAAVTDTVPYMEVRIREGDLLKITFPGAPSLDMVNLQVRRDGKITLSLGGEILAVGRTPAELEKEILRQHGTNLTVQQVVVALTTPGYPVFVSGSVLRPGKLSMDRPITALEAIMEAGGPDNAKANLKKVVIIRKVDGQNMHYPVDIKAMMDGRQTKPFYLKPDDIVMVPEKFNWF